MLTVQKITSSIFYSTDVMHANLLNVTLKPIITSFFVHALFIRFFVLFVLWLLVLEDVTVNRELYSIPVKT